MLKILLSFMGAILLLMVIQPFEMISTIISWQAILVAAIVSFIINYGITRMVVAKVAMYKLSLYSISLLNFTFVYLGGALIIVFSSNKYAIDSMDFLTPYITLFLIAFVHSVTWLINIRASNHLV
jgi:hypothetical protein